MTRIQLRMWILLFLAFGVPIGIALDIVELQSQQYTNLPVTVSRGAFVHPLPDVLLYTELEYLIFTVPDMPDPPTFSVKSCPPNADKEACDLFKALQSGLNEISQLLLTVNRIFTTRGLNESQPANIEVPSSWVQVISNANVASLTPPEEMIQAVGEDWFEDTEALLTLRRIMSKGPGTLLPRQKRWLAQIITPALHLAKYAGFGDVVNVFKKLFVGDNDILSYLAGYKLLTKEDYKVFTELPRRVSQLQTETKRIFLEIMNSTEQVKRISQQLQIDINDHVYRLATIEEAFLREQSSLADIIRALYTSIVYSTHMAAYDECRANQLPVAFVPPSLLRSRLAAVEKSLPENIRFAIQLEDFQRYYRLPLAECLFDSNGGIIRLSIPLVEKQSKYKLYEFKAIHFAYNDYTCTVQTPSSFIIKNVKENKVHVVTDVDEEWCHPTTTTLCKIPLATVDDSSGFCASVLLSGEPASVVKNSCPLKCFRDKRPIISQLTDNSFVGVHLPPQGVKLVCPSEVKELDSKIVHGAVRFQTGCNCRIMMNGRTVGKTTSTLCDEEILPKIDVLIPVQMTTFDDLLPFSSDGIDNTVFSNPDEVVDRHFVPENDSEYDTTVIIFRISTGFWNILQSAFMAYLYLRINAIAGAALAVNNLPRVRGSKVAVCDLPDDVYFLLYLIIALIVGWWIPVLFGRLHKACKNAFREQVVAEAQRLQTSGALEYA